MIPEFLQACPTTLCKLNLTALNNQERGEGKASATAPFLTKPRYDDVQKSQPRLEARCGIAIAGVPLAGGPVTPPSLRIS